jgi:hypothetical protein
MNTHKHTITTGQGEREAFAFLRSHTLSTSEKEVMRQALETSMAQSESVDSRGEFSIAGLFAPFFGRAFAVALVIIILVVSGGYGVAQAANQSLPGETLYPVKTHVSEPLIGTFQWTDEKRALWEHTRAERRLKEAETLAETGRLGENEKKEIEQELLLNRKNLEQIEGHAIPDEEFIPANDNSAPLTRVRIEHNDSGTQIHVEERKIDESDSEELDVRGDINEDTHEQGSSSGEGSGDEIRGDSQPRGSDSQSIQLPRSKNSDGGNNKSPKVGNDRNDKMDSNSGSNQKVEGASDSQGSSLGGSGSSGSKQDGEEKEDDSSGSSDGHSGSDGSGSNSGSSNA